MFKSILITGGAGFVGSHVTRALARFYPASEITVVDRLTYAGDLARIPDLVASGRVTFKWGDITSKRSMIAAMKDVGLVVNLAAESHVDRSFADPILFQHTNAVGAATVFEAARTAGVETVLHVSTDEVYGTNADGLDGKPACDETASFLPTNPYAASKASADLIAQNYHAAFGLDVRILRPNNIFGTAQNAEKLIPTYSYNAAHGLPLEIHDGGQQRRGFLHASDFCTGLITVLEHGEPGAAYNMTGAETMSVRGVAHAFLAASGNPDGQIIHRLSRPINDANYLTDDAKLRALGWAPEIKLTESIPSLIRWYGGGIHHEVAA